MNSTLCPEHVPLPHQRKKVEVTRRIADISKAQRLLSFHTRVSLREGLGRLCRWLEEEALIPNGLATVQASAQGGR